jgi:hypothetical protein
MRTAGNWVSGIWPARDSENPVRTMTNADRVVA